MSQFSPADMARAGRPAAEPDVEAVEERVEQTVARLDELDGIETAGHVEVFESVQQTLADTLSAVDEA